MKYLINDVWIEKYVSEQDGGFDRGVGRAHSGYVRPEKTVAYPVRCCCEFCYHVWIAS